MKLLNKAELAAEMDVSRVTVDNWLRRGCPYVSRGRNGKEWKFDLEAVKRWRHTQEGYQDTDNLPKGMTGNGIRDFSTMSVKHFFTWLINEVGPAWVGMMKEAGITDKSLIKKLYVFNYIVMNYCLDEYIKRDEFNRGLKVYSVDLDKVWNTVALKPLQGIKTTPAKTIDSMPESIRHLLEDKRIRDAAKEFCKVK